MKKMIVSNVRRRLVETAKITDEQFLKRCAKIAEMTDGNDHSAARIEGAKLLQEYGYKNGFVKLYECIKTCHDLEGSLPRALDMYRADVDKRMWAFAEKVLNEQMNEAFQGAF